MPPPVIVAMMIARGTVRFGSLASSDSVETASKPRKDRHRIAAPAMTLSNPGAVPSPVNGAARSTVPVPDSDEIPSAAKARMKIACARSEERRVGKEWGRRGGAEQRTHRVNDDGWR